MIHKYTTIKNNIYNSLFNINIDKSDDIESKVLGIGKYIIYLYEYCRNVNYMLNSTAI